MEATSRPSSDTTSHLLRDVGRKEKKKALCILNIKKRTKSSALVPDIQDVKLNGWGRRVGVLSEGVSGFISQCMRGNKNANRYKESKG